VFVVALNKPKYVRYALEPLAKLASHSPQLGVKGGLEK